MYYKKLVYITGLKEFPPRSLPDQDDTPLIFTVKKKMSYITTLMQIYRQFQKSQKEKKEKKTIIKKVSTVV